MERPTTRSMRAGQEAAKALEVNESATPVDAQDLGTDGAILSLQPRAIKTKKDLQKAVHIFLQEATNQKTSHPYVFKERRTKCCYSNRQRRLCDRLPELSAGRTNTWIWRTRSQARANSMRRIESCRAPFSSSLEVICSQSAP